MKEWMTAREIAEAGFPDLPTTKRGIAMLAASEKWDEHPAYSRQRKGKGGGVEYHFRLLPTLAQVHFAQRTMVVGGPANDEVAQQQVPDVSLSDRAARERDARLAIVGQFEKFCAGMRLKQASCLQVFTDKYNGGTLAVEDWVREVVPHLSKRTLLRWKSAKKVGQAAALAVDRGQSRKGTGVFDLAENGRLRAFALALIIEQPHFAAKHIRTLCIDEFGDAVEVCGKRVAMPPIRTFQWALKQLKTDNRVLITKVTNPDKYRSTMLASGTGMMRHIGLPNELWMIDASPVDALCVDGRHSIYIAIDLATRRIVITVSRTPRASAVGLMIRKAALEWGVPQQIKTDNGSDFVAEATKRLFTFLDIEPIVSAKYSPAQKAHVERVIGTFQRTVGPLLPGFIGHDVADRKAIEERKAFAVRLGTTDAAAFGVQLTGAELQAKIDDWVQYDYQHQDHSALGTTPFAAAAAAAYTPRMVDARALDVLLMAVPGTKGQRRVTRQGIRIADYHYGVSSLLPGTQVFVRMDPADMGTIYAFTPDGAEFLGEGTCPELAGVAPAAFWAAVREAHADVLREGGKWMEAERRRIKKGPTFIDRYLRVKKAQNGNVVALPKRTEEHSTPQIAAALDAIGHTPAKQNSAAQSQAQFQAQLISERANAAPEPTNIHPLRNEETNHQRFNRALDIERRLAAGEPVEEREEGWLQGYRTGSEYRSMRMIHDDFGGQASL
tara:strand:- start:47082 stop:49253 length:2172 start_codon:yes stop_codon:yes gene_type:complete